MRLKNKVAMITGGGAGIGAKIVERFVAEGAKVCSCDIQPDKVKKATALFSSESVTAYHGDVSKQEDVEKMVRKTIEFGGKIDILVNNAGVDAEGNVIDIDPDVWQNVLDTNINGAFLTTKTALPKMIEAGGGVIVNMASLSGLRFLPGMPAYCTSKGALMALTKQVALDFGPSNIRCNAVCPGPVKAGMLEAGMRGYAAETGHDLETIFEQIVENVPLRRVAAPEDIAAACVFLASDDASFITGTTLLIDGGLSTVDPFGITLGNLPK